MRTLTLAALPVALSLNGCTIHDGAFEYEVSGRLVDENSAPLAGRPIHVQLYPFRSSDPQPSRQTLSDPGGVFTQKVSTGLAWGYRTFLGIPLGSKNPPAPPLEVVYLAVEQVQGPWIRLELTLTPAEQHAPSAVQLGDVRISD